MNQLKRRIGIAAAFVVMLTLSVFLPAVSHYIEKAEAQTQITGNGPFTLANFFEGTGGPLGTCNTSYNYGLIYWDHTNQALWVCATSGYSAVSSGGGSGSSSEDDVTTSTTPTFSPSATLNTMILTANVGTSFIPSGIGGFCTTFILKQSGGTWSFTWPTNTTGGMPLGPGRNSQQFCYYNVDSKWVASGPGVTNE